MMNMKLIDPATFWLELWLQPWRGLQDGAWCRRISLPQSSCNHSPWSWLGWTLEDMEQRATEISNR